MDPGMNQYQVPGINTQGTNKRGQSERSQDQGMKDKDEVLRDYRKRMASSTIKRC